MVQVGRMNEVQAYDNGFSTGMTCPVCKLALPRGTTSAECPHCKRASLPGIDDRPHTVKTRTCYRVKSVEQTNPVLVNGQPLCAYINFEIELFDHELRGRLVPGFEFVYEDGLVDDKVFGRMHYGRIVVEDTL